MQTFHLPKEKGYYLQLKLMGHWAAFEQHTQADICMRNVKMRLWCICNFWISIMFLIVLPLGSAWDTFPLAKLKPRKRISCSAPPHYLFHSEITFPLLSLAEVWKNMLMTGRQRLSGLPWGGREMLGKRGREAGLQAPGCVFWKDSQQQHWTRTSLALPSETSWDVLWVTPPVLCSPGLVY